MRFCFELMLSAHDIRHLRKSHVGCGNRVLRRESYYGVSLRALYKFLTLCRRTISILWSNEHVRVNLEANICRRTRCRSWLPPHMQHNWTIGPYNCPTDTSYIWLARAAAFIFRFEESVKYSSTYIEFRWIRVECSRKHDYFTFLQWFHFFSESEKVKIPPKKVQT